MTEQTPEEALKEMIQSYYGECQIGVRCHCSLGSLDHSVCSHWVPIEASTWEEAIQIMKLKFEKE